MIEHFLYISIIKFKLFKNKKKTNFTKQIHVFNYCNIRYKNKKTIFINWKK